MVRITEELVRKKSEHNELLISTLEEISLHQEDIEKIEHIQNWCRDLKILLLQSNLIERIENLHKLKKLEYLNLALNCIEKIENLEQLESLHKLDLTLNFIGDLQSIENLKNNYNFRELILVGNPCSDYPNYRDYIIAILPQLNCLDSIEIKRSDKIQCAKNYIETRKIIIQCEAEYRIKRDEQKTRVKYQRNELEKEMSKIDDEDERNKYYWNAKSEHCPETRRELVEQHRKNKCQNDDKNDKKQAKREIRFFAPCGRPFNMNQCKLQFNLIDEPDRYELDLQIFKFLDTSLIDVDVQPNYVRVAVKKKYFQLALTDEVKCSESVSKRSQITGRLLIIMPKLKWKGEFILDKKQIEGGKLNKIPQNQSNLSDLKGTVNYKNIVKPTGKQLASSSSINIDDNSEIPALI